MYNSYLFAYLVLLLVYCLWQKLAGCRRGFLAHLLFYGYLCAVLSVTVLPIPWWNGLQLSASINPNLIPFIDIQKNLPGAYRGVMLNIILFLPMGAFLAYLVPRITWYKAVLLCLLASLGIECTQLSYWVLFSNSARICDVTDIITNTCGGLLGYWSARLLLFLLRPSQPKACYQQKRSQVSYNTKV